MKRVVFDIETVGKDFDTFDKLSQEYILKYAKTDEEEEKEKDKLGLYPLTAEIVTIGMLDIDTNQGLLLFKDPTGTIERFEEDGIEFVPGTEEDILKRFWEEIRNCKQFITFNGRAYDCPFLIIRSAILGIKPTRNLMPQRYDFNTHIDLLEQLTFYGAMRRRFGLHMWCMAFGIKSPKEKVSGEEVGNLYREGKFLEIARYCVEDIIATKELYLYWEKYIKITP